MKIDYVTASVSEVAQHFKSKSRQVIHAAKDRYQGNPQVLEKLERAYIMAKIARLEAELEVLEKHPEIH